jgi:hypothetical protein
MHRRFQYLGWRSSRDDAIWNIGQLKESKATMHRRTPRISIAPRPPASDADAVWTMNSPGGCRTDVS